MSAIFGIISLSGSAVDPGDISTLATVLASWSPESATIHPSDGTTLGCCHLRTTPESLGETLPWQHPPSSLIITADARLDNRAELLAALDIVEQGRQGGVPDSEIILEAFLRWGSRCPDYMLGDFVFAIWNPNTRELFCARDHLGGKPLAYARCSDFFAFASSPEALLALPWTSNTLESSAMANLMVYAFDDMRDNATWYADVDCVPPGNTLRVDPGGREHLVCYWRPEIGTEFHISSEEEAREAFRELFGDAMKARLRSIHPPAILASGGMDSSSIGAMADILWQGEGKGPFHTYSVISDNSDDCIESRCIEALTRRPCFVPHYLYVPSITGVLDRDQLFRLAWDNPHPVDSDILLQSSLIHAAAQNGQRVMLHGTSGDLTLWSSRQYIAAMMQQGDWLTAWRECRAASDHHTYYFGHSALKILAHNGYHAFLPPLIKNTVSSLLSRRNNSNVWNFLNPEFARCLDIERYFHRARTRRNELTLSQTYETDLLRHIAGIKSSLGGANRLGGRYGVEMRDPFGDRRLVQFFLCLPQQYKVRDGWTKYLSRTAFPAQLPDFLRYRRGKESLGRKVHLAVMNNSGFVDSVMTDSIPQLLPWLDSKHLKDIHRRYHSGDPQGSRHLFDYMTWARWLERIATMPSSG